MMELMDALCIKNDTPLMQFDEMRHQLELSTKKEDITVLEGNIEIIEVIKGFKMTKRVRKPINKRVDMKQWINLTSERYSRYIYFMEDSKNDYPDICKNVQIINNFFENKLLSFTNMTKLVYKTDKALIKLFRIWKFVE